MTGNVAGPVHYGSNNTAECGAHGGALDALRLTLQPSDVTCAECRGWLPIVAPRTPAAREEGCADRMATCPDGENKDQQTVPAITGWLEGLADAFGTGVVAHSTAAYYLRVENKLRAVAAQLRQSAPLLAAQAHPDLRAVRAEAQKLLSEERESPLADVCDQFAGGGSAVAPEFY